MVMKINKFNEENSEFTLTPDIVEFTEWCLVKTIQNGRYFYNSGQKSWFDDMEFKPLTWDEIFEVFLNDKYNTNKYNL